MTVASPNETVLGPRAVAEFLLGHAACRGGFEVRREGEPPGQQIGVRCRGCGARLEYEPALVTYRPGRFEPRVAPRATPPPGPPRSRRRTATLRSRVALKRWVALGLAVAAATVPAALLLSPGDRGEAPATRVRGEPAEGASRPPLLPLPATGGPHGPPRRAAGEFQRIAVASRFSIALPAGWERGASDGGIALTPRGTDVPEVRVFFERRPDLGLGEMATETASFLAGEHAGAVIGEARAIEIEGARTDSLVADYGDGEEYALLVTLGSYRYLVLRRVEDRAHARARRNAIRVARSFRPF